jgi:hypothetical protein
VNQEKPAAGLPGRAVEIRHAAVHQNLGLDRLLKGGRPSGEKQLKREEVRAQEAREARRRQKNEQSEGEEEAPCYPMDPH